MNSMKKNLRVQRQRGFTLIELMIALLLGLLVVAAAGSIFLSNRRTYGTTETVNRIQENQRAAFELLARDIREAAGSPCSANPAGRGNVLKDKSVSFWNDFGSGLKGTDGVDDADDSLELYMANGGDIYVTLNKDPAAVLDVNKVDGIKENDVLMVCNADVSIVFGVTQVPGSDKTIQHNNQLNDNNGCGNGPSGAPSNSFCVTMNGVTSTYCFGGMSLAPDAQPGTHCERWGTSPASVVKLSALRWYVGTNTRGGKSLYRQVYYPTNTGLPNIADSTAEVVEGVRSLEFKYQMRNGSVVSAGGVGGDWGNVVAVQLKLDMQAAAGALRGQDLQGTDGNALHKILTNTVVLRNREAVL